LLENNIWKYFSLELTKAMLALNKIEYTEKNGKYVLRNIYELIKMDLTK